jgi:hypothetical protein
MAVLDVRKPVLPAPVEDSNPLECESTDGSLETQTGRPITKVESVK